MTVKVKTDKSEFENSIEKLLRNIRSMLPELGAIVVTGFQAYIGAEMGLGAGSYPSNPDNPQRAVSAGKLTARSGRLYRSFGLKPDNSNDSITAVSVRNGRLSIRVGSALPYARIQDVGGKIRSKGKMEGFFMHKYMSTKNGAWLGMYLKLKKQGFLKINPTHYFSNASRKFELNGMPYISRDFYKALNTELKKVGLA